MLRQAKENEKKKKREVLSVLPLTLGIFKGGGAPLTGCGLATTKAFEGCCCALSLMALWSAVSSTISAFLINDDYGRDKISPSNHTVFKRPIKVNFTES